MLLLGDDEDEVKPAALVAVIENVYAVPAVNPEHSYVVLFAPAVHVAPDGLEVTT